MEKNQSRPGHFRQAGFEKALTELSTVLIKINGPKKLKNLREIGNFQMH